MIQYLYGILANITMAVPEMRINFHPRTGRRGVPQQFPRKLYEMLEAESQGDVVHWSSSGLAFRITNLSLFTSDILPKYFKTSKFSSFQRNLNLYGFTKIRKGPDIDHYSNPYFSRGDENGLSQLRKRGKGQLVMKDHIVVDYSPSEVTFQPSCFFKESMGLAMLADAMTMMIEGECQRTEIDISTVES